MRKHTLLGMAIIGVMAAATTAGADTVRSFEPSPPQGTPPTPGVWYATDVRTGGTADIVDLTGVGGTLAATQPLPVGAARLLTDLTNEAKAEVGVFDSFGLVQEIKSAFDLRYYYFKETNPAPDSNTFAAPAIRLTFFNPVCDDEDSGNDCFGTLVYEPYWNGNNAPAVSAVVADQWNEAVIDWNNGYFWWTGGFGKPNGSGGPPLLTLADWEAQLSSDFADAALVQISVGVGTFNKGQIGYFDKVAIAGTGADAVYDFEPPLPYETLGQCISGLIAEHCGVLKGTNRAECNREKQAVCFEAFGVK